MSNAFIRVLRAYHAPMTREEYLNTAYAGNPPVDEAGDLPAELESELPSEFQRKETLTHEETKAAEENAKALVDAFIAKLQHDVTESE